MDNGKYPRPLFPALVGTINIAASLLQLDGFSDIVELAGGIAAWQTM